MHNFPIEKLREEIIKENKLKDEILKRNYVFVNEIF